MIVLDANVLIYAYDPGSPQHAATRAWFNNLLDESSLILIPWVSLWALLRVSTNPRASRNAPPVAEVFRTVRELLDHPRVRVTEPGPQHAEILERLAIDAPALGSRLTDAVLAAIAIENGAALASTEKDFRRFDGLRLVNPLTATR